MSGPKSGFPTVFPVFRYADAPAAVDWLERAFGFERGLVAPAPDGSVAHAELSHGAGAILLGSERAELSDEPWAKARFGVYVAVDDVDAHYARATVAGARIVRELQDTDYGSREFSALDLEGHLWSFGTYRPGDEGV